MVCPRWLSRWLWLLMSGVLAGCANEHAARQEASINAPVLDCSALQKVVLPNTVMKGAVMTPATMANEPKRGAPALPEHCLVTGEVNSRTGVNGVRYGNNFELRLPRAWNGRFQFMGVGGTAGYIPPAIGAPSGDASPALAQGYAVVTSDMGHSAKNRGDASFGLDPQARIDWGYNAVDVVTVAAKALIRRYYGKSPAYSYFVGCSGGGRQAMMAALRNPGHFDGVVAGAPILEQHIAQIGSMQILQEFTRISPPDANGRPILSRSFTDADLRLIDNAVVARCDPLDGLRDGIIDNYPACSFDPGVLECAGEKTPACLSSAQVGALKRVMEGPKNSRGEQLYHGRPGIRDSNTGAPT
jgi:Tannase and feruloyl esterase